MINKKIAKKKQTKQIVKQVGERMFVRIYLVKKHIIKTSLLFVLERIRISII